MRLARLLRLRMTRGVRRGRAALLPVLLAATLPAAVRTSQSIPLAIGRFRDDAAGFAAYSGIDDATRVVIRDVARWQLYWRRIHARMTPMPPVPTVDFTREMVVLAALGARSSGGYAVRVDSAYDVGSHVDIIVVRSSPGRRCLVTAAFTQPVDVVRLPLRNLPVRFQERESVEEC